MAGTSHAVKKELEMKKNSMVKTSSLADGATIYELKEPIVLSESSFERFVLTPWILKDSRGKERRKLCIRKMWRSADDDKEWKFSKAVVMLDTAAVVKLIGTMKLIGDQLIDYIGHEKDVFIL